MAAKLDQIPVPDMADSIWSGIETRLNAVADGPDMPAREPVSAWKATWKGTWKDLRWYGLAVAVVVALLWWYFGHGHQGHAPGSGAPPNALPEQHQSAPVQPAPVESPPVEDSHNPDNPDSPDKPAKRSDRLILPGEIRKDTASLRGAPGHSIRVDSAVNSGLLPMRTDSSSLERNRPALPDVDLYGNPPPPSPGKKHKGVKGITGNDYMITAGKDSARKKN
jgi:hypothetical protein